MLVQRSKKIIHVGKSVILDFIKKIIGGSEKKQKTAFAPKVYTRAEHNISRSKVSENALKVLYRLNKTGFEAYLVGGCVRDLLLGREPKDFDVVTDASPEQVRKAFRNCRLIGRRFRLAHVHFGREIIEVATFRAAAEGKNKKVSVHEDGRLKTDNIYGTIEEDVWRRDFTVNALYYNIVDFSVSDYTGGMLDHADSVLRLIGDPKIRFREDPVRMLRAVRFAVKLGFTLNADCEQAIFEMAETLTAIPSARLHDEALKLFMSGYAVQTFEMLRHYGLFEKLFPATELSLASEDHGFPKVFIARALENSDTRIAAGKSVTPYFLIAAFLWEPLQLAVKKKVQQGLNEAIAFQQATNEVISTQVRSTAFPKRVGYSIREVWGMQSKFKNRRGAKPFTLLQHQRFRAAYDFLLLRAETGGADMELADWWTKFQDADEHEQKKMTRPSSNKPRKRRRASANKTDKS